MKYKYFQDPSHGWGGPEVGRAFIDDEVLPLED